MSLAYSLDCIYWCGRTQRANGSMLWVWPPNCVRGKNEDWAVRMWAFISLCAWSWMSCDQLLYFLPPELPAMMEGNLELWAENNPLSSVVVCQGLRSQQLEIKQTAVSWGFGHWGLRSDYKWTEPSTIPVPSHWCPHLQVLGTQHILQCHKPQLGWGCQVRGYMPLSLTLNTSSSDPTWDWFPRTSDLSRTPTTTADSWSALLNLRSEATQRQTITLSIRWCRAPAHKVKGHTFPSPSLNHLRHHTQESVMGFQHPTDSKPAKLHKQQTDVHMTQGNQTYITGHNQENTCQSHHKNTDHTKNWENMPLSKVQSRGNGIQWQVNLGEILNKEQL